MPDNKPATYTAVITISLPDSKGEASAHLTLAPLDLVDLKSGIKPLKDCTLAELQLFADQMENEIWEVYQSIKLIDLSGAESVQVAVELQDRPEATALPDDWQWHAVVLPAVDQPTRDSEELSQADAGTALVEEPAPDAALAAEPVADQEAPAAAEEAAPLAAQEPEIPSQLHAVGPEVTVSESESLIVEREAGDDPGAFPTPAVAPSQARVRIAGRRLAQGHPTWAAADILIDEPALRAAQAHALSSLNREVAGVMLGPPPEKQPDGRYVVHVIDTIVAKHTVMNGASVTYTPESWRYMNDKLFERYPEGTAVMVGWYHTHPGFGIFLSGMDQFIHQNFFTQIWHTALVLDPVARKSGFFCWDRAKSRVGRYEFGWPKWAAGSW